jgi:AmmeMemoRadiSam system protein B
VGRVEIKGVLVLNYHLVAAIIILFSVSGCAKGTEQNDITNIGSKTGLRSLHVEREVFESSIKNPRDYDADYIIAGVIPHHLTAATLISGFFVAVANQSQEFDTVVIVGPHHYGGIANIIYSKNNWNVGEGVECDTAFFDELNLNKFKSLAAESDELIETDHSTSVYIPYINHYLPNAKVAPIMLSRSLTLSQTLEFSNALNKTLENKNALLICSVDFSHYLTPIESVRKDDITLSAINENKYSTIFNFSNNHLDSPPTLITFLRYMGIKQKKVSVLDHTDASEFLGTVPETTSYFVLS